MNTSIAVDSNGIVYAADSYDQVVRRYTPGTSSPVIVAGVMNSSGPPSSGDGGLATNAHFDYIASIALDGAGNLFIVDGARIRKLNTVTGIISTVVGNGSYAYSGDGGPGLTATLAQPNAIAFSANGDLYIADGSRIRKVAAANGIITTVAGSGAYGYAGDNGPALQASFGYSKGLAIDLAGNLYVSDWQFNVVRKVNAATDIVTTVVGTGSQGYTGDGGSALSATLNWPENIVLDPAGNLYIADHYNGAVRKVDAAANVITSVVGSPNTSLYAPDGYPATYGKVPAPAALALDASGNLYVTSSSSVVLKIVASTTTLLFPATPLGQTSAVQPVSIVNIGNQTLNLNDHSSSGPFIEQAPSGTACQFPGTLAAGSACSLAFAFTPAQAGIFTGTLTLTDNTLNQANAQQQITLRGPYAQAIISPASAAFGIAPVGSFAGNSWFTVSNSGNNPLNFTSISVGGANPADFVPDFNGSNCRSAIPAQSSCQISVDFIPQGIGPRSASLIFTDSAADSPQTVQLNGTGAGPANLSANLPSFSFGNQNIGTTSGQQTVTLTNTGGSPLHIIYSQVGTRPEFDDTSNTCYGSLAAGQSCTASITFTPQTSGTRTGVFIAEWAPDSTPIAGGQGASPLTVNLSGVGVSGPVSGLTFVPVTPCRIADTRSINGPLGGPEMRAQATRDFDIPSSACGIPSTAVAYSLNVTAVPDGKLDWLTIWPAGQSRPLVSTLNSDGRVKANAAIVSAGTNGAVSVYVTDATHIILDVNGYFVPAGTPYGLAFYPLPPCRVADTREAAGLLGGPYLSGEVNRSFPIQSSSCNIPSTAQAYSLNITALPHGPLRYLSMWPAGQDRPVVSTLNATSGAVTANAAIVPAGTNGDISFYATSDADLIIDINGYFGPPGTGGLLLYPLPPCRALDTREATNTALAGTASVKFTEGACGTPATAQAYVLNATVVPPGDLDYLTLWPDSQTRPVVSTLNAYDGAITSNMAIVPSANGSINTFVKQSTHLILDVIGYFAP
ncbi:MAG: choice-of-anchor D domain-containing protein [Acidobacteriaceae bacterium]|nr:choice-of-anchor D domain-containing protein [Acidobacteriaceae bacterium]